MASSDPTQRALHPTSRRAAERAIAVVDEHRPKDAIHLFKCACYDRNYLAALHRRNEPAAASDPGVGDRRRPGDGRPVRAAARHLCRLHGERACARVHRGRDPHRRPAALRQHPHRVVRDGTADEPAARGCAPDHPRRRRRRRRHLRDLLRLRLDRRRRQARRRARAAPSVCARTIATTSRAGFRPSSARWCSSARTSITPTSCRGGSRSRRS